MEKEENITNQGLDSGIYSGTSKPEEKIQNVCEKRPALNREEVNPRPSKLLRSTNSQELEPFDIRKIKFVLRTVKDLEDYELKLQTNPAGEGVIINENVLNLSKNPNLMSEHTKNIYYYYLPSNNCAFVVKLINFEHYWKHRQEFQLPLANQTHPWMIKILGIAKTYTASIAIFMEYVSGMSIDRSVLPWPEDKVIKFLIKLLHILKDLYSQDTVHGDIKVETICLREPTDVESLVLIDWECAKNPKFPINFRGTVHYSPPWLKHIAKELPTGNWIDVFKSLDRWAVGILGCLLVTGNLPWLDLNISKSEELVEYIEKHPEEIEKYYRRIGGTLGEVIRGLLPKSGKISDQIGIEDSLHILEDRGKNLLRVVFRGETFENIPSGLRFEDILAYNGIKEKIQQIKDEDPNFQHGVCPLVKTANGKFKFLNGSSIMKDDFEIDVKPPASGNNDQ